MGGGGSAWTYIQGLIPVNEGEIVNYNGNKYKLSNEHLRVYNDLMRGLQILQPADAGLLAQMDAVPAGPLGQLAILIRKGGVQVQIDHLGTGKGFTSNGLSIFKLAEKKALTIDGKDYTLLECSFPARRRPGPGGEARRRPEPSFFRPALWPACPGKG